MQDDVSSIPSTGCTTVNSSTVIYNYSNNVRRTYTQIGGKWYYTAQQSYTNIPSGAVCVSLDDYSLSSKAEFEPIYLFMSLCIALFIIISCLLVMFGRFIKWRL